MGLKIKTMSEIADAVRPLMKKYNIEKVYLFGSYARNEADDESDIDFLVFGGENFKPASVFSFAEELRIILDMPIDVFEINEINTDSEFYKNIMREKVMVA